MSRKLGSILVLIVAGALMLYSASRTMHMLSATLPAGQEILAVIALAAFDLGLIAWLIIFLRGAAGGLQRGIALLMIVVDLLGVIVGFLGDTLMTSGDTGLLEKMAMGDKQTIIMATAFVIAFNIAGAVFYHMADPDNLRRMTEEAAKDKITSQALRSIETQASILANELAPQIAEDWVNQMRADFTAALTTHQRDRTVVLPAIRTGQPTYQQPAAQAAPQPSRMEGIKDALNGALFGHDAQPQTMAADGTETNPKHNSTATARPAAVPPPAPRPDVLEVTRADGTVTIVRPGEQFTVQGELGANGSVWPPGIYEYKGHDDLDLVEDWTGIPKAER